ncbi:MAG: ribose-phosphate pyrophosphokinase-like domain-containing protein [Candidatus Pacebacteria bacterium]|nr:ribose-phosphate pyrophosphokinase-like domain-containing protein [Candidatus Paceibacterota bacterium]
MKKLHVVIPTTTVRHLFAEHAQANIMSGNIVIPTGNKEGAYRFPDGEVYLRVPGLKHAEKIIVVHSGYPDPNGGLIELYMLLDIIEQYNPRAQINVVFTCIPYARQDKAYYEGELNAAQTLINTLTGRYGVSRVTTIDAHFAHERWTKKLPITNVSAVGHLKDTAAAEHPGIIFMAPDAGSTRRTHIKGATKQRLNSYNVTVDIGNSLSASMNGQTIGVVDDILATGTTLERFYQEAKRNGAKKVFALITHGCNPAGIERIKALYDGLYLTNSINRPEANVQLDKMLWALIIRTLSAQ